MCAQQFISRNVRNYDYEHIYQTVGGSEISDNTINININEYAVFRYLQSYARTFSRHIWYTERK